MRRPRVSCCEDSLRRDNTAHVVAEIWVVGGLMITGAPPPRLCKN